MISSMYMPTKKQIISSLLIFYHFLEEAKSQVPIWSENVHVLKHCTEYVFMAQNKIPNKYYYRNNKTGLLY